MKTRYDPLNDYLFFKVMGEKGDEVQLLGFLNAVLGRTGNDMFSSVEIVQNRSFSAEVIGDKSSILDVRAVLQSNTRVNVEVQLRNQHNMDKRSLFYWSKEYSKCLRSGQDYRELPDVIAINIVNFNFLNTGDYHTCFHLREDRDRDIILTGALEMHFLDMVKYRKQGRAKLNDPLCRWLAWLDAGSPVELVTEAVKMDAAIQSADERMVYVTGDEEAIHAYEMRQMALSDLTSVQNYAHDTGLEEGLKAGRMEGLKEGRTDAMHEIALKMMNMGDSVEKIHQVTGLSVETIGNL